MFSCEFWEIFKTIIFTEHLCMTASFIPLQHFNPFNTNLYWPFCTLDIYFLISIYACVYEATKGKKSYGGVLRKSCSDKFHKTQIKTPVPEFFFQWSCRLIRVFLGRLGDGFVKARLCPESLKVAYSISGLRRSHWRCSNTVNFTEFLRTLFHTTPPDDSF